MESTMSKKPATKSAPVPETGGVQITISGSRFTVAPKYAAGHILTAGEAAALEQTRREAIRNNLASKVKDGKVDQAGVDEYAAAFQFGERNGGFTSDPLEAMALTIARRKVKKAKMTA